jgi:hypothetical protein
MVQFTASMIQVKMKENTDRELGILSAEMSRLLAEEIDRELMLDMLVATGWTKVELERLKDRYESIDIGLWIDENCTGKHTKLGRTFAFEKKQDAEWFILTWL